MSEYVSEKLYRETKAHLRRNGWRETKRGSDQWTHPDDVGEPVDTQLAWGLQMFKSESSAEQWNLIRDVFRAAQNQDTRADG